MNAKEVIDFIKNGKQDIRLEYCGKIYGKTNCVDIIWINIHQMIVETFVHEMLHCIYPMLPEDVIELEMMNITRGLTHEEIIEIASYVIMASDQQIFEEEDHEEED